MAPKKISGSANRKRKAEDGAVTGTVTLADMGASQHNIVKLAGGGIGLLTGCRIPKAFFVAKGFGETDSGGGVDPHETGSYDLALEQAGIQDFNIMQYTSVMPPESHEVSTNEAQQHYSHGAVLECIMSVMHGAEGDRISAGVGRCKVRRMSDGFVVGGYAAEYKGHAKSAKVKETLRRDLTEIFKRRYEESEFEMIQEHFTIMESEVSKAFGTVLASICFVSYINPIVPLAGEADDKSCISAHSGTHAGKRKKQQ